jgi:hypothetical protein
MLLFGSIFEPEETAAQGSLAVTKNGDCIEVAFNPDGFTDYDSFSTFDART